MNKILLSAVALLLTTTVASAGSWAPENIQQVAAAEKAAGAPQTQATGPVTCHMVWAAADKGMCLNEFPIAHGGRLPAADAVAVIPATTR